MDRRNLTRVAIVSLTLVLALVTAWGFWERNTRAQLANAVEADYQREFYDLLGNVEQTEVLLAKAQAANSARQHILYLTEVYDRANNAQTSLAELPFTDINMSASRKFLAQTADYCYSLARKVASDRPISASEWDQLARFHEEVGNMAQDIHGMEAAMAQEGFRWSGTLMPAAGRPARAQGNELEGFRQLNERMERLPALVYDGPFSDARLETKPRGLTGSPITLKQAKDKAQQLLETAGQKDYQVTQSRTLTGAPIPAYSFVLDSETQPGVINLDVSRQGGHLIWMLNNRQVGAAKLSVSDALKKARDYLQSFGYPNMIPTSSYQDNHTLVASFAYNDQGVVCYPDLIKVRVALDNGQVIGVEATSFLMNHRPRQLPAPRLNLAEIAGRISPRLTPEKSRLALIPLPSGQEVLAYEVEASIAQDRFLVYINSQTGEEEQLLKIINLEGGQVTM